MHGGWPFKQSPFHEGERQVQERVGVREQIDKFARRVVRDHMPDEHRDFYEALPYLIVGTLDDDARPWASILAAKPGFITSPDPGHLDVKVNPLHADPLGDALKSGAHIGILGIELATRRRNRISGRIESVRDDGFTVAVDQAYGNCPQYIQARDITSFDTIQDQQPSVTRSESLDAAAQSIIEQADTLFIATAYAAKTDTRTHGIDVSHRGGKPGFVRVEDERTFVFPDFSGNNHYNTIGNIVMNPKAGFLFPNFETGALLYVSGAAEIIWDGPHVTAFSGAQRLIRLRSDRVIHTENALPLKWHLDSYSSSLSRTGSWEQALTSIAAEQDKDTYAQLEVFQVERESDVISSFYLRRADGKALKDHEPGQFLPITLDIPGQETPAARTYTISNAPNGDYYRLSIKRESADALVSNLFHDTAKPGFELRALAPRGKFVLDTSNNRPVVLLSAGVGITPMIAFLEAIAKEERQRGVGRRTFFIHGARNSQAQAFSDFIRAQSGEHKNISVHVRYSAPLATDRIGRTHDSEGHIDIELLREVLPFDDYDFYLCGPHTFMQSLFDGLINLGVREERIHYESFGPATVLKRSKPNVQKPTDAATYPDAIGVSFKKSNLHANWAPESGTLLELAEAAGLNPSFSCRSGICGTCATRVLNGNVEYVEDPSAPHADDEVLICCATPKRRTGDKSCGKNCGLVLDL